MSYEYDCLSHCPGEHTDSCVAYNDAREAYQREPYRWSEKETPMNSNQNTWVTQTNVQQPVCRCHDFDIIAAAAVSFNCPAHGQVTIDRRITWWNPWQSYTLSTASGVYHNGDSGKL